MQLEIGLQMYVGMTTAIPTSYLAINLDSKLGLDWWDWLLQCFYLDVVASCLMLAGYAEIFNSEW